MTEISQQTTAERGLAPVTGSVSIPANAVESVLLVIREAAECLEAFAKEHDVNIEIDWRSRLVALRARDHVKKLAWVYSLIKHGPEPIWRNCPSCGRDMGEDYKNGCPNCGRN